MAIERSRPVRRADNGLLTRRLIAATLVVATLLAIGVPGARAVGYELERRALVVERMFREVELRLLTSDLEVLTVEESAPGE
jgi:hypothetical protein